jgi:hypothetical protein
VEIYLDGVVFNSGQFAGPDTGEAFEVAKAHLTAARETAQIILARHDAGANLTEIAAWLTAVSQEPAPATPHGRGLGVNRQTDPAVANKGVVAMFLSTDRKQGEQAVYDTAQSFLKMELYR